MAVKPWFVAMIFEARYHHVTVAAAIGQHREKLLGCWLEGRQQPAFDPFDREHVDSPRPARSQHIRAAPRQRKGGFPHFAGLPLASLSDDLRLAYKLAGAHLLRLRRDRQIDNTFLGGPLPQPSKKVPDTASQSERFKEAARELGCDDDPERFKETVRKLAKAAPQPRATKEKTEG